MQEYPFATAQLLTDTHFLAYGGETGTSTPAQRNAAYFIAERQMTEHIGTLLLPTVVTGSWYMPSHNHPLVTDYGYVTRIDSVFVNTVSSFDTCELVANDACALIRNDRYGYLDVGYVLSACACGLYGVPYSVRVTYQAGLPTGTSLRPDMLLALTMAAQINLNEIDNHTLHNEGAFDIGVQRFSSQGYMEERTRLGHNAFGSSAAAQKIANLVKSYRCRRATRFH